MLRMIGVADAHCVSTVGPQPFDRREVHVITGGDEQIVVMKLAGSRRAVCLIGASQFDHLPLRINSFDRCVEELNSFALQRGLQRESDILDAALAERRPDQ